jgi:hypothetical protein
MSLLLCAASRGGTKMVKTGHDSLFPFHHTLSNVTTKLGTFTEDSFTGTAVIRISSLGAGVPQSV